MGAVGMRTVTRLGFGYLRDVLFRQLDGTLHSERNRRDKTLDRVRIVTYLTGIDLYLPARLR
jgi:hypothetical protein